MSTGEVARSVSDRGEMILLRRTDDAALELRVNGVFVMDTANTSAERELARRALAAWLARREWAVLAASTSVGQPVDARRIDGTPTRVLVGGLGLGFTLLEVLVHSFVGDVVVAEIHPELIDWHRAGLIPHTSGSLNDARVEVVVADVADVVRGMRAHSVDVLLLDVDNGPDHLVYDANAALYRRPFLQTCATALTEGGCLAIWSADASPGLRSDLAAVYGPVDEVTVPVVLGRRQSSYTLFLAFASRVGRVSEPVSSGARSDTVNG